MEVALDPQVSFKIGKLINWDGWGSEKGGGDPTQESGSLEKSAEEGKSTAPKETRHSSAKNKKKGD